MTGQQQLKVLIVDDHDLVRAGIRRLLEENPQLGDIHEARSGEEAVEIARQEKFDLVLMDITLPGISGMEASDQLLSLDPANRIIMVTAKPEGAHIRRLLNAGVRGYITKGSSYDVMDRAMNRVMAGEQYLSPDVAQQVAMDSINGDTENPFEKLSERETEITNLLLRGQSNRQIGDSLFISEKTVHTHRKRAFEKLGVSTISELVRLAIRFNVWNEEG